MDTNRIIRKAGYGGHPRFREIAKFAANFTKLSSIQAPDELEQRLIQELKERFQHTPAQMRSTTTPIDYTGVIGVDFGGDVVDQISTASRIPCAVRSAVLPDAHLGYALPVGGVIALENAVSPHFIGFDIACRMTVTVLDLTPDELLSRREGLADSLRQVTAFGIGSGFEDGQTRHHPVVEKSRWSDFPQEVRSLRAQAQQQLGSSGGGNHFADLMVGTVEQEVSWLPLERGQPFTCLVTHSGSRGVGHKLATRYSKKAVDWVRWNARGIPKGYEWLPLDDPLGQEYWEVMQLMGEYAQANHHTIHDYFLAAAGLRAMWRGENHHNFAWKESYEGRELIVHRKGATPAHVGDVGIIPGSMGTPAFLVEGKGRSESLNSAAHGAGRVSSRTQAKRNLDKGAHDKHVQERDILTFGVGDDESYQAYKDIEHVISLQEEHLKVIARMFPRVVVMGGKSDDGD